MKKSENIPWLTIAIILGVLILALAIIFWPSSANTPEETMQCIAEKTVMYSQLGCHACATQEQILGEQKNLFTIVDCWQNREECIAENIQATPTWKINENYYRGVHTIEQLKQLTKC